MADEEDVALSAFDSFCRGAAEGRFPQLVDRNDLGQLLVLITARKAIHLLQHERRQKRGGGKVQGETELADPDDEPLLAQVISQEPTPEFAAQVAEECRRLLDQLGEGELRSIALWKMEGYTTEYVILDELGRRGMGVVYKARQVQADRIVALKMIVAGLHASPEVRRRFYTEARLIARLQHPHIVQVFEVTEHCGLPLFSLEYCPGGCLETARGGELMPPREAARLMGMVARAVHYAHELGVVHRDLKPANILLAADGTPKVVDFGLAKSLDEDPRTSSGKILGTPCYMAPEQARGHNKEVGPTADVYALGAVLYELLTGRPPFQAETPLETVLQVISSEVVPPRHLRRGLSRDLNAI
jgi:serine/threonine protein kinase